MKHTIDFVENVLRKKFQNFFQKNGIGGNERGTPVMIPIFKSGQRSCLQMRSKIITSVIWLHLFIWLHCRYDKFNNVCSFKERLLGNLLETSIKYHYEWPSQRK